jgi:hypothetical protein
MSISPEELKRMKAAFSGSSKPTLPSPGSSAWYKMKKNDPAKLAQLQKEKNIAVAKAKKSTPKADPKAGPRPPGVSQYVWDRVSSNTLKGLNTTAITRDPEVREALIKAGHEDYVKAAYEKSMDQRAAHYGQNGAEDPWATAQESWYNQQYGTYKNDTVGDSNTGLSFGGSTGDPKNADYVAPEPPEPVVEESPATGGNPGGMFGSLTGQVQDTRPPEETSPGGAITGPTQEEMLAAYEEKLAAAQAAQQAAYEQQLAAQQAQYEQQVAAQQAAQQAAIEQQNAAKAAAEAANNQSWANANAAAAGVAGGSGGSGYTKKYGEGGTGGGLMAGIESVKGNSNRTAGLPTGGARPSGSPTGGFKPNDDTGFFGPQPSHQPTVDGTTLNKQASNMGSTPWADAFIRSKKAAEAPGPVSGMMSKWME